MAYSKIEARDLINKARKASGCRSVAVLADRLNRSRSHIHQVYSGAVKMSDNLSGMLNLFIANQTGGLGTVFTDDGSEGHGGIASLKSDVLAHYRKFAEMCGEDPARWGWWLTELREHLPLSKWESPAQQNPAILPGEEYQGLYAEDARKDLETARSRADSTE